MYHFFIKEQTISDVPGTKVLVEGENARHIKQVLRLRIGELLYVHDCKGQGFLCELMDYESGQAVLTVLEKQRESTELPCKITLFQGLPKSDKLEWIIQKAVELGVSEIVPVKTKRTIVKLTKEKEEKRLLRWNSISEGAAKQSGRMYIPRVQPVMEFAEALHCSASLGVCMIPYENATEMTRTREIFSSIQAGERIGIFIGPEGGFTEEEVALAEKHGISQITLGKRILRTETAGIAALAMLTYQLEEG